MGPAAEMAASGWIEAKATVLLLLLASSAHCNDDSGNPDFVPPASIPQNPPIKFGSFFSVPYDGKWLFLKAVWTAGVV